MSPPPNDHAAERCRRAFERSPAAQLFIDADAEWILDANPAAVEFYGRDLDQLRQLKLSELLIAEPDERARLVATMLGGSADRCLTRQRLKGGDARTIEVQCGPIDDAGGGRIMHAIMNDVSERVQAEARLHAYRDFYENLPVPMYRATRGATGRFVRFNPAFLRLFEAERPEQLFERNISDLYDDPRERERFSNELMKNSRIYRYELRLRTLTGRVIHCVDTAYQHEDEHGQIVFDGVLEDVTHQRELEQQLAYQARHDEMTGLTNRRQCDSLLATEIERCERYGQPLSLLMIDLDHFKRVNDESGHAAGDLLLQRVADCIRVQVRQTDTAARWGGEEFMVVLPSTRLDGAARLAEKLRPAIGVVTNEDGDRVTASIGYGEYCSGEGRDAFLARIDRALYAAKDEGRDRVRRAERHRPSQPGPDGSGG